MSIQIASPIIIPEIETEELNSLAFDLDSEIGWIGNRVSTLVDLEIEFGQLVDSMETAVYRGQEKYYYDEHLRKIRIISELLHHTLFELNKGYDKVDKIRDSLWRKIIKNEESINKEMTDNKNNVIRPLIISEETIREMSKFLIKTSILRILAEKKSDFNIN